MSQRLSVIVAESLKKGDTIYHNVIVFTGKDGEQIPATAKVTGKCKVGGMEDFSLPIRRQYGDMGTGRVTKFGSELWRTTPEKEVVKRIVRSRLPAPEPEAAPVKHVRRTRR